MCVLAKGGHDVSVINNLSNPRRLRALAETCLVNSPPEDSFDRYTRLCSALLSVPVAAAVLVEAERLYFKSRYFMGRVPPMGLSGPATQSFCQNVVIDRQAFVVEDARENERTRDSLAVTQYHIRAYAGLPLRNPEGEILGSFCAVDFQPRVWTEQDLAQLEDLRNGVESEIALRLQVYRLDQTGSVLRRHLRATQQLFRNLDHEVRTPLNAILNLSLAAKELELPPQAAELIGSIHQGSAQLTKVLEGVLDLAALEAGQVLSSAQPTNLTRLMEAQQAMVEALGRKDLELQIDRDPEMPEWVNLDGSRLGQLLAILLQCHLSRCEGGAVFQLQAHWPEAELLELRLSCDGYSLTPEEVARLFASGVSDGQDGLSLTVVNALVELLYARLWGQADERGVHFQLRLPVGPAAPPAPVPDSNGRPLRLLAIDDDPTNLRVLEFLAEKLGHTLHTAGSGMEGLELLDRQSFDILLLDLRMPDMDGFEVSQEIRRRGLRLPILAVTADVSEASRQRALSCGMNGFMTKPIKKAELSHLLSNLAPVRG